MAPVAATYQVGIPAYTAAAFRLILETTPGVGADIEACPGQQRQPGKGCTQRPGGSTCRDSRRAVCTHPADGSQYTCQLHAGDCAVGKGQYVLRVACCVSLVSLQRHRHATPVLALYPLGIFAVGATRQPRPSHRREAPWAARQRPGGTGCRRRRVRHFGNRRPFLLSRSTHVRECRGPARVRYSSFVMSPRA